MRAKRLQLALENLGAAIKEIDAAVKEMRAEHDPLAVHIFMSRRSFRQARTLKSGKPQSMAARLSWQAACELGYRGDLREWERLMGA